MWFTFLHPPKFVRSFTVVYYFRLALVNKLNIYCIGVQRTLNDGTKFTKIDYPNAGVLISTPKLFGNCYLPEYYVIQMIDIPTDPNKHKIKYRNSTKRIYRIYQVQNQNIASVSNTSQPHFSNRPRLPSYLEYPYLLSDWGVFVPGINY